jgi:hypothetical protein
MSKDQAQLSKLFEKCKCSDSYKRAAKKAARPTRPPDARCMLEEAAPDDELAEADELGEPLPLPLPLPLPPVCWLPPRVVPPMTVVLPPVVRVVPPTTVEDSPAVVDTPPAPPPITMVVFWPGSPTTVKDVMPAVPLYVIILVPLTPAGIVATTGGVVTPAGIVATAGWVLAFVAATAVLLGMPVTTPLESVSVRYLVAGLE